MWSTTHNQCHGESTQGVSTHSNNQALDNSYSHWSSRIATLVDFYGNNNNDNGGQGVITSTVANHSNRNSRTAFRFNKCLEQRLQRGTTAPSAKREDSFARHELDDEYANDSFEAELQQDEEELKTTEEEGEMEVRKTSNNANNDAGKRRVDFTKNLADEDDFLPSCFLPRIVAGTYAQDESHIDYGSVSNPPTPTSRKRLEEQFRLRDEDEAAVLARRLNLHNQKEKRASSLRNQPIAAADAFLYDGIGLKAAEVASELNDLIMFCRHRNQAHDEAVSQLRRSKLVRATCVVEEDNDEGVGTHAQEESTEHEEQEEQEQEQEEEESGVLEPPE